MPEQFFIGRAKELERLERVTLKPGLAVRRPRLAHIWGPEGCGKTALLKKFISLLPEESQAVISFHSSFEALNSVDDAEFYEQLFASGQSNVGDLVPWLVQLKADSNSVSASGADSLDTHWSNRFTDTLHRMLQESVINPRDLYIFFAVDNIAALPLQLRTGFCSFIDRICNSLQSDIHISVLTTGDVTLQHIPDLSHFWSTSITEAEQIELANLTRDETFRLLESHDLDANLISKIYNQSAGNPGQIMATLQDQNLQSQNFEESFNRGKNLMYQFNNFQRRWIQWAAIMRHCNEESISMITEGREVTECINWIRNNYPGYFDREGNDYILRPDFRRAILAYVQRTDPRLYSEINEIVQRLTGVRHVIPNSEHRNLLSQLGELHYFDFDLLKKLFSEETYRSMLKLIENKPVFFRQELESYRLASNIRTAISIYNQLRKNPDRDKFRHRVRTLWEERQRQLHQQLDVAEKDLHEFEERNRSLSQSIGKIETELQRLRRSQQQLHMPAPVQISVQSKRSSLFGAMMLQLTGIVLLYVNTLILDTMSISYLLLSGICLAIGVALGARQSSGRVMATPHGSMQVAKSEHYDTVIRNLEVDLVNLMHQKEQAQHRIERDKLNILNLQASANHTYLSSSD